MARVLRGDLWWAEIGQVRGHEQAGDRPVLVISHETFNAGGTVIALAVTSQPPKAGFPLVAALPERTLPKPSWVKIGQVRTMDSDRLKRKAGRVEEAAVDQIVDGLFELVG
ncbi:MAG: type II toxin-antitoxin system PemK/MazF family toxin [Planctomycetota bacterium]